MTITPVYAALLGLFFVLLSVRILRLRYRLGIAVGDGDHPELLRSMRVHGNFAEYVPLTLVLIALLESQGSHLLWVQGLCVSLLFGRLLHAYGLSQVKEVLLFRILGMGLTLAALLGASLGLLLLAARFWIPLH